MTLRGFAFPGIIHNDQYFLTDLKVYADGLIECWEMVDLRLFKARLKSGWVVPSIPDGAPLNIHGIGILDLDSPDWTHTGKSLIRFIQATTRELNPRMENLYNCHGRVTEEVDGLRYSALGFGKPRPWKFDGPVTSLMRGSFGHSVRHFLQFDDALYLVTLAVFPDDTVVISGAPEEITLSFEELKDRLGDSSSFRLPEPGDRVRIDQLVSFTAKGWRYRVDPEALCAEIHDLHEQALGRPPAVEVCILAFQDYLAEQTADSLERLRRSYEAVPEHLRVYCGDMDTKDIPIRMILYGRDEIENWSHHRIARERGMELPSIRIPDPPKDQ